MIPQSYIGIGGTVYSPGREIGRGGEGIVYEVKEDDALVVKVYNEQLDSDKAQKLRHMHSLQDASLNKLVAWPQDVVYDRAREMRGFVMRKLEGFVPLHMLFSPMDRKRLFPDKGYNFLVHVARNLATAFHKIHQAGIVIGDVNEGNILVNAQGIICFIDSDSFQVENGNTYHFCEVGILRYTPPELLNRGTFNNVVRTSSTDSFSLAVLIFQLLFLGRHPFTGINMTNEDIDEERAIKTLEFAYSLRRSNKKLSPAKNSLDLRSFAPGITALFHEAFETIEERPLPATWTQELDVLSRDMSQCSRSKLHHYPRQIATCPWCQFVERSGIVFFLDDTYLQSTAVLSDLDKFINGYQVEQIVLKQLDTYQVPGTVSPRPIGQDLLGYRSEHRKWFIIGTILCATLCLVSPLFLFVPAFFSVLFSLYSPIKKKLTTELQRRTELIHSLKANAGELLRHYNNPAEMGRYTRAASKLEGIINNYRGLHAAFARMRKDIDEKYYNEQYHHYLQRFEIAKHTIPSFGAAKKMLLLNNGIISAADISKLTGIKIPSIGPKNIQILKDWQRQVGVNFTYIPNHLAINKEVSLAMNEIAIKRKKFEEEITAEYSYLQTLKTSVVSACASLERKYTVLAKDLQQAEADIVAFKVFMRFV